MQINKEHYHPVDSLNLFTKDRPKSINNSLHLFWKNTSKDTRFVEDLKHDPGLERLINYDTRFNNKDKVLFESALAGLLRAQPGKIRLLVNQVAQSIWPEIEQAFLKANACWISRHLIEVFLQKDNIKNLFLMDIEDNPLYSLKNDLNHNFYIWMRSIMHSECDKDVYKQLELICRYGHFFMQPFVHMQKYKFLNNNKDFEDIPKGIGDTENKEKMRLLSKAYRINWPASGSTERARVDISATAKRTCSFGIFPPESKLTPCLQRFILEMHPHYQGLGAWRVTDTSPFTKAARHLLDMPLIASQSDSIALLLIPAMVAGKLDNENLRLYNLGALSFLVGDGHHSIHECKPVWSAFNIPYVDGDYSSLFPKDFIKEYPDALELQKIFPTFMG